MNPVCDVQRCKRRVAVRLAQLSAGTNLCKTHARVRADMLFASKIRQQGHCVAEGDHLGYLQCAHIISRCYHNIRWDERNAVCLCARHHSYFTHHPVEWDTWVEDMFPGRLAELRPLALNGMRPDLADVLAELAG
jgi:hypothetical protein